MALADDLRSLNNEGGGWKEFFAALAGYVNRVTETTAERAAEQTGLGYDTIISGMKKLAELKIGEFKYGRHRKKSRIIWRYSPSSVGRVAQGKQDLLDCYEDDNLSHQAVEKNLPGQPNEIARTPAVMIEETKRTLAAQLGVNPEQIDIVVRY